jgi:hypothetical protein
MKDQQSRRNATKPATKAADGESGPMPPMIDPKLLAFIQKYGGRVSVRQLARSLAACRTAPEAERRLAALVSAGMGEWVYSRPGPRGGRPARLFVLTIPPDALAPLLRLAKGSAVRGSQPTRQIARDLVAFLNHWQRTPCRTLAKAASQVANILSDLAKSQGEYLLPMGRRTIRLSARGALSTSWNYP